MAAHAGLNFDKDQLILYLNLSDRRRSWKGAPTTNLTPDLSLRGYAGISLSYVGLDEGWKKYAISGTWNEDTYPYSMSLSSAQFIGNVAYSTSCYLKINCEEKFDNSLFGAINYVNRPKASNGNTVSKKNDDGTVFLARENFAYVDTETQSGFIFSRPVSNGTVFDPNVDFVWIKHGQIEEGSFATPYVNGTRDATNSLVDILDKTSVTINSLTYRNDGLFEFNGASDSFYVYPSLSTPNKFTCQGWIRPGNSRGRFITPNSNGIDNYVQYNPSNESLTLAFTEFADTNNRRYSSAPGSVPIGEWTNFAVAIDNRDWYMWINGELVNSGTASFQIGTWNARWTVGQRGNGTYYYRGEIYELLLYNRLLNTSEVRNKYLGSRAKLVNTEQDNGN